MTLQELAQLGGTASGVGVIASFIYVAIQIRNNTRAVRAAAFQNLVASNTSKLDELARNGELCSLILRGGDDFESLDRVEKARFRFDTLGFMQRVENAYMQHSIGTIRESDWASLQTMLETVMSVPGRRVAWNMMKSHMSLEFRTYVDDWVSKVPAVPTMALPPDPRPENVKPKRKASRRR